MSSPSVCAIAAWVGYDSLSGEILCHEVDIQPKRLFTKCLLFFVGNIWYNNYAKVSYVLRKQSKVSDY